MKVYLIPGLGFDHRIFEKLDLRLVDHVFLPWIEPIKNERFEDYARRMAKDIPNDYFGSTILIGHSLGGMLCQEIARFKQIDKVILISSVRYREEIPLFFKLVYPLSLHHLFTKKFTLRTFPFWSKYHDYQSVEEQNLFKDMLVKHSDEYLQWALKNLSLWQPPKLSAKTEIFRIHGKKDRTFPAQLMKNVDHLIPHAGHFMVYKKSELINDLLFRSLAYEN